MIDNVVITKYLQTTYNCRSNNIGTTNCIAKCSPMLHVLQHANVQYAGLFFVNCVRVGI